MKSIFVMKAIIIMKTVINFFMSVKLVDYCNLLTILRSFLISFFGSGKYGKEEEELLVEKFQIIVKFTSGFSSITALWPGLSLICFPKNCS